MRTIDSEWIHETTPLYGEFEGERCGSDVSIIFTRLDTPGRGPALHQHPYSETFLIRKGVVRFTLGKRRVDAVAGEIVVATPETPHQFVSLSDEVEMIDIHASGRFITEWL
ncbi:mannose-6-phosphate isomerase-like protein (cupin superfamily) [Pseudorhizobium tarimense]|uniref:Mannose-6-phosphate isomerase-like protein (Cupin superfamily) n=1 Tax=Pseudorhizobium tarimense TaxID=1079109 RepID=A0ABV2HC85_9HYPH|nr:cupin domain-containing protein [Pseudorhizobium tarimense]MCJ8521176.1 cupin domain-containing protein [Pseudorhizobium tarimense]